MGCPPVRGDNPRALASGLSYVQVDKHGITIYTTYISVDLAHHEIFCAKAGRGGTRCFSRICFALSQLGFNIPPGFNIPLGINIPVGSQVYRKIPVEIPLGFNIPVGSHRDLVSQWDPGGIPSGSRFYFHLGSI